MTDQDASAPNAHAQMVKLVFGALNTFTVASTADGLPVAQQGTWTVGLSAGTNTNEVVGDAAHDAAVAGNPLRVGAYGKAAAPTDVSADGDTVNLWADLAGRLSVWDGGLTLSIDDGAGAITVDNGGTFAVQASLSAAIPAGTNNIGDVDVLSVVPGTSATALGKAIDTALGATDTGVLALTVRDDALATLTEADGDVSALRVDSTGRLWANVSNTVTVASHAVTNAGTFAVQVDGNALTALQLIDDPVIQDDAAFTPATTKVMMAGFQADESSTDSVDEGDGGAARMTLDRKVIVTMQPHTAGGCTPIYNLDVDETEDAIKASAGQLYELYLLNTTNAILYVKLYNATTANVTVGTTTPALTIPVPGNNDTDGAGVVRNWPAGLLFDTAITIAATTAAADNDTGAPAANAIIASGAYK